MYCRLKDKTIDRIFSTSEMNKCQEKVLNKTITASINCIKYSCKISSNN